MSNIEGLRRHFVAVSLLATAILLAAAAGASAFSLWPHSLPKQPQLYIVEGYLDQAPAGTKILDDIRISVNQRERTLLITSYGYGEVFYDLHLSRNLSSTYFIRGPQEELQQLTVAPAGTRIAGTFAAYTDGPPWLLFSELNFPTEDEKAKSAS